MPLSLTRQEKKILSVIALILILGAMGKVFFHSQKEKSDPQSFSRPTSLK
ncbi:MAG: hypothetical protein JKY51_09290 [Opitutaceae bacterium]|nr:hypothetical protein [Opitutaceae bacterium]